MDKTPATALLLAGGCGHRMHSHLPKQFMRAGGQPVISHTMQAFQRHPQVDRIYVVCNPEWADFVKETATENGITKFCGTFPAGQTSMESLKNGVQGLWTILQEANPPILTHEAVRPLVSESIITHNLAVFRTYGNAVTAIRSNEAYMVSPGGVYSEKCVPRELLYRAQTPLTFRLDELTEIFRQATPSQICGSQSLYTLVSEVFPEKKLYISQGSELNFKLTLPEDIEKLEALLAYRHNNP